MENLMMYDVAPFLETPVIREAARPIGNMGSILLECGRLSAENVEQILRLQKGQRVRFGEAGRRLGLLHDSDIRHALALQFRCASLQMGQGGSAQHLAAACRPFSNESRGLRSIRSQLTQQGYAHGRKTLAIVGVDDTDSSLFAANLALVYAQIDKRTLLIDANLRAERQAAIFGAGPVLGLSDVLAGRAADEAIMPAEPFHGLSLLTAGTPAPNPDDLLARGGFQGFHASLLSNFDLILIDGCKFSAQAESLAIADRLDGAILVVRKDRTRSGALAATVRRLQQAGVVLAGTVLLDD
jgi:protein-tyrosine kinase